MKGEIFNLLESFLEENFGEDRLEAIIEQAADQLITKEPFVGPGTYPDADLFVLAHVATKELDVALDEALFLFGKYCLPKLLAKLPRLVDPYEHPKELLRDVDGVIHVEVKKLYDKAEPPKFTYKETGENSASLVYESKRRLYDLAEGLLAGVSEYYGVPITVERQLIDDARGVCEFQLTFD